MSIAPLAAYIKLAIYRYSRRIVIQYGIPGSKNKQVNPVDLWQRAAAAEINWHSGSNIVESFGSYLCGAPAGQRSGVTFHI